MAQPLFLIGAGIFVVLGGAHAASEIGAVCFAASAISGRP
jgi:hypothetical protein